jgi:hypothetical protein
MALGRRIACCLGLVAATVLLLGCGSSDSTSANIDPQISSDLTGQLDRIEAFFRDGNCDRATGAVDNLEKAVEAVSGQTGEQFTSDMKELVANLGNQVADECEPPEDTTTTPTTTDEPTESQPMVTEDTTPTETSSTTKPTTSSTSTTTSGTTSTPPPPPGNGPPVNPPGGGTPGGGINPSGKRHSSGPANKEPKPDKGHQHGGPGSKHGNEKEHGR